MGLSAKRSCSVVEDTEPVALTTAPLASHGSAAVCWPKGAGTSLQLAQTCQEDSREGR